MTLMSAPTVPEEEPPASTEDMATFRHLLVNTLVSGVTSSFLWFALTFWVYLETRSVVVTGVIGGAFGLATAAIGPAFGTYVDHHRKHAAMVLATTAMGACFALATAIFVFIDADDLLQLTNPWFWVLVAVTLGGSVAGSMRGIAMSTCVTLLVPEDRRDRANGMVGTVTGVSFALTSVFSGLAIGQLGMGWALYLSVALTGVALLHLQTIHIDEPEPDVGESVPMYDVRGAIDAIRAVRGLAMIIGLAAFNNLLTGVFMALMDAYGLELVSVETWGLMFGFTSLAFIAGGMVVSRRGLGSRPLRLILLLNLVNWAVCSTFTLRPSIGLMAIGTTIWMGLIPAIEAAEQTVLQRTIPFRRQGRVFGFAQLVENAAAPVTAFVIGPLAEIYGMPFMTDGSGADLIGDWFGTGPDRGIALMFTIAGLVGIVVTVLAWRSRSYRALSAELSRPEPLEVDLGDDHAGAASALSHPHP
jgi:DHA3 family multidrug efflux protein-like MFS transporter